MRKAQQGGGARGRGTLEGSRRGAPLPGSPKCRDGGPTPWAGVAGGAWQSEGERSPWRTQCLLGLASAASFPP